MSDPQAPSTTETSAQSTSEPRPPFIERLGDSLQKLVGTLAGNTAKPPRLWKSLLSGTWLRHPLHPLITDVPVGAWLLTALLDILWLISPSGNAWAARGAQVTVLIGVLAGLAAVVTGSADWSDTYGRERTVGLYHGLLQTLATVLYIISTVLRFSAPTGDTVLAAILGFAGLVVLAIGAYLGGDLVFDKGTQVNHTAWEHGGDDYEAVMPVAEATANKLYRVTVGGVPVVLVKLGDSYAALAATCTHAGGPLDEGELQGTRVQCPWHGSRFDLRTGAAVTGPASMGQPRYDVRVRDGQIELKRR
ncbi:MAG TPA: DUF2231 domain-containing protein [Ktedonobacterales bacterium]|nr:DUF2231 domain-containing protein [Ktedonobacterales bacterium]